MGSSEMEKSLNEEKEEKEPKTPVAQEPCLATTTSTVNPEWSGFQNVMPAYSPMHPHGFMASSPQPHPYMWGVQHLMPPYGTPPHPYVAMYPPGGMYAHPHMPPGSYPFSPFAIPSQNGIAEATCPQMSIPGNMEVDGKPSELKEKLPIKRSKGSLGSLKKVTLKNGEPGKSSGGSANGGYSKSAESGSEGSSDGSDANSQNELQVKSGSGQDLAEASQNGSAANMSQNGGPNAPHTMVNQTMAGMPVPIPGVPGGPSGPTTTLNIGLDYWGNATPSAIPTMCGKVSPAPVAGAMGHGGSRDNFQSQIWDERELKRQRRKQSNRESARRSRLRKQAECDELAQRARILEEENASLKAELNQFRSEYEQLLTQNASLKETLGDVGGQGTLKSDHLRDDTRYSGQEEPAQSDQ